MNRSGRRASESAGPASGSFRASGLASPRRPALPFFLIMLLAFLTSPASAGIRTCQVINASGSYVLDQSISNSGATCLVLNNTGITLDCAGFNITGSYTSTTFGILANRTGAVVQNCNVTGFHVGIRFQAGSAGAGAHNSTIRNCTVFSSSATLGTGLYIQNIRNVSVVGGNYTGAYYGAIFESSNSSSITNATARTEHVVTADTGAFVVYGSNDITLTNITGSSNTTSPVVLVYLKSSRANITGLNANSSAGAHGVSLASSGANHNLDCAGGLVYGSNSSGQYGVYDNVANTTVKNCLIENFNNAVQLDSGADNGTFTNNTLSVSYAGASAIWLLNGATINKFIANNITSPVWVDDLNLVTYSNYFNNSTAGNIYYWPNGTASWEVFNIIDTSGDNWADIGSSRPFNNTGIAGNFSGSGWPEDWFPFTLNQTLYCSSLSAANTVYNVSLDISVSGASCFEVTAANVTLNCAGHSVSGNNASGTVGVHSTQFNTTIRNCRISNFSTGISLDGEAADYALLTNNTLNITYGTLCLASDGTCNGVFLNGADNATLANNTVYAYQYGINLYISADDNIVQYNNATLTSDNAIYLTSSTNNDLLYNNASAANNALYLSTGSGNNLTGNRLYASADSAISLTASSDNTIEYNTASAPNGPYAIGVSSGSGNIVRYNNASASSNAIFLWALTKNNIISYNNASSTTNTLFIGASCTNNTFANNTASATDDYAVRIDNTASDNNTFFNNTLAAGSGANPRTAIYVQNPSGNNTFWQNNITAAVWVSSSNITNNFSSALSGNIYYFANGTASWDVFNISDTDGDNWADAGSALPFNATTVAGNWSGNGSDWHPFAINAPPNISALSLIPTTAYVNSTLQCNVTAVDAASSQLNITYNWSRAIGQNNTFLVAGSGSASSTEGQGSAAAFSSPYGVAVDPDGWLYVADYGNHRIRKINTTTNQTYLVAGSSVGYAEGAGSAAKFNYPQSVVWGDDGYLYVGDYVGNRIRKINVTTNQTYLVAGNGSTAYAEGAGNLSAFYYPSSVAWGSDGYLYVSDERNNRIRKINTTTNQTYLVAGNGSFTYAEGAGNLSAFYYPKGVAWGSDGYLHVADYYNYRIRKINTTTNQTYLVAGSSSGYAEAAGSSAKFNLPNGVDWGDDGFLYVADLSNYRIRKINTTTNQTYLVAGSSSGYNEGTASGAKFQNPSSVAWGSGWLYVADSANNRIRKISAGSPATDSALYSTSSLNASSGSATLINLTLSGTIARMYDTWSCSVSAWDGASNSSANSSNGVILSNSPPAAPTQTAPANASIQNSTSVTLTCSGSSDPDAGPTLVYAYYGDTGSGTTYLSNSTSTYAWTVSLGTGTTYYWMCRAFDGLDFSDNSSTWQFTTNLRPNISSLSFGPSPAYSGSVLQCNASAQDEASSSLNVSYVLFKNSQNQTQLVAGSSTYSYTEGTSTAAAFRYPSAVAFGSDGYLYVTDTNNHRIRKINATSNLTSLVAGTGSAGYAEGAGSGASFSSPQGAAWGDDGYLYIADTSNNRIRKINTTTNQTYLVAGNSTTTYGEGAGNASGFYSPSGLAWGSDGWLYVADTYHHRIRKINTTTNQTYLVAGTGSGTYTEGAGSAAAFYLPKGLAWGSDGYLYVADTSNNRVRRINTTTNQTYLVAGSASTTYAEGTGAAARFNNPQGIAFGSDGYLYVTDYYNQRIRKINTTTNQTSLVAGSGSATYAEGTGPFASFYYPTGLAWGSNGYLYIADYQNNRVRRLWPAGLTLPASNDTNSSFNYTLNSSLTAINDIWSCAAYAYDGYNYSAVNYSANLTISNSNPENATISSFTNATSGHQFNVTAYAEDADGASDITDWNWTISSGTCANASNTTDGTRRSINLTCTGTAFANASIAITFKDAGGLMANTTASSNVYPNQIPLIEYVLVTPRIPAPSDTLVAANGTISDADGDSFQPIYNWKLNGAPYASLNMPFEKNVTSNSSGAVRDYSGNENNGTLGGGASASMPAWNAAARIGHGAYGFDGSNDFIEVSDNATLDFTTQLTITAWIKQNSTIANGYRLVDKITAGTADGFMLDTYGAGSGRRLRLCGATCVASTTDYALNSWQHVAMVFNGSTATFYLNGTATGSSSFSTISANALSLRIGRPHAGCGGTCGLTEYFSGLVQEVQLYNRSLSAAQVLALYQNNSSVISPAELSIGQNWSAEVWANDRYNDSLMVGNNTTIQDYPLLISYLNLTPTSPYADETLLCNVTALDNYSSSINISYSWFKNGANQTGLAGSANVTNNTNTNVANLSSGNLSGGDNWSCAVRAYDGTNYSAVSYSSNVTILQGIVTGCQNLSIANQAYNLSRNVSLSGYSCFNITASNVTLDCRGFSLTGSNTSSTNGVQSSQPDSVVRNCLIYNFDYGVLFSNGALRGLIQNNTVNATTTAVLLQNPNVDNTNVTGNTLTGRASYSLYVLCSASSGNCQNISISSNAITSSASTIALYVTGTATTPKTTSNIGISNNTISSAERALQLSFVTQSNVFNNTVIASSVPSATGGAFNLVGLTNSNVSNNSVRNSGTGYAIGLYWANADMTSINNIFFNNTIPTASTAIATYSASNVNNTFYGNNITATIWLASSSASNDYNSSGMGNIYYFPNGTGSWEVFDITDTSGDSWADAGSKRPFNSTNAAGNWTGSGGDWHPFTLARDNAPNISAVAVAPSSPYDNANISCNVTALDDRNSSLFVQYEWYLNGANQGSLAGNATIPNSTAYLISNLTSGNLTAGQNWSCNVRANDSYQTSFWNMSANVTILSSALQCSNLSEANTVYNMSADLAINGYSCFNITAANVTLDCNSYSITGNNTTSTYGVYSNQPNSTIKNCRIQNFSMGIYLGSAASNSIIANNSVNLTYATSCDEQTGACSGISLIGTDLVSVTSNNVSTISTTTAIGINLYNSANNNSLSNNSVTQSAYGIFLASNSNYNTITNNRIYNPGSYGFRLHSSSKYNALLSNYAYNSSSMGFYLSSGSNDNSLSNNYMETASTSSTAGALSLGFTSAFNSISNNTINSSASGSNRARAILLSSGQNNTFFNNTLVVAATSTPTIDIAAASGNNTFYQNSITSSIWVSDSNDTNLYNSSGIGNIYYFPNNTGAWEVFNLVDTNITQDYWADAGTSRPLNNTTAAGNWTGYGQDWFPYTTTWSPPLQCSNLSEANTVYNMTTNLSINGYSCFNITAANVTLDCNSFTITGNSTANTYGVYSSQFNSTVQNCAISNFGSGIYFNSSAANYSDAFNNVINITYSASCNYNSNDCHAIYLNGVSFANISNNRLYGYRYVLSLYNSANSNTLQYNNITPSSYVAIMLASSSNNLIQYNNASGSSLYIVDLYASSNNNILQYNTVSASSSAIIFEVNSINNTVQYSSISASSSDAISLKSNNNILIYNNISAPSSVVSISPSSNNNISYNNVTATNDYAISVSSNSDNNTFANNTLRAGSSTNARTVISSGSTAADSNKFYYNNITGAIWVNNANETNTFNTTDAGNIYYFNGGTNNGSWSVFDIVDTNGDSWADAGAARPFNSTTAAGNWTGYGQDWFPYTTTHDNAPNISAIAVVPSSPYDNANISCNVTALDDRNTSLTIFYEWYLNGANQTSLAGNATIPNSTASLISNLTSGNLTAGQNWSCNVQAYDSYQYSSWNMSANVTILQSNTAPNIVSVSLTPAAAYANNTLYCNVTANDSESSSINISYSWSKNGVNQSLSGSVNVTNNTNTQIATLAYGNLTAGDQWSCAVQAYDGSMSSGLNYSANVTILEGILTACQNLSIANQLYTMGQSVSINGYSCFNITAANVTLNCAGYTLTGNNTTNTYGVYSNQFNTNVQNCRIINFGTGIYLNSSAASYSTLSNNFINITYSTSCSASSEGCHAIYLRGAQNSTIQNNRLYANQYGLNLYNSASLNNLTGNNASATFGAIALSTSSNNNTIQYSNASGNAAIYLISGSSNNTVQNNTVSGTNDILYVTSSNNIVQYNNATSTNYRAISISGSNNTIQYNKAFASNQYAISLSSGSNNTIQYNNASTVTNGIYLSSSSNNIIQYNNASASSSSAIALYSSSNSNVIQYNNASVSTSGNYAVYLSGSSSNNITGNTLNSSSVTSTDGTVYLTATSNSNRFTSNIINNTRTSANAERPIRINSGSSNTFFNNTVVSASSSSTPAIQISAASSGNNTFYRNNITSSIWVNDANGTSIYNSSGIGNVYYFANNTSSWSVFRIYDNNSDSWADSGLDRPFNATTVGGNFTGSGNPADWHPFTLNSNPAPSIVSAIAFTNASSGHWFYANATATDNSGVSDILSWNVSTTSGSCVNYSNTTSGQNLALVFNCSGTALQNASVNITFIDSAGNMASTSGSNAYPNQLPNVTNVSISPSTIYKTTGNVTCNATNSSDADNDTVSFYYLWYLNGTASNLTAQNITNSSFSKGLQLICQATPYDGYQNGTPVNSSPVTVLNSLPNIQNMTLTNQTQMAWSQCRANVTDGDGQSDLLWVNFTITRPNGSIAVNNIAGTQDGSTTYYNSSRFNLSADGDWNCTIIAVDSSGASVNLTGTFSVTREWQKYYGDTTGQLQLGSGVAKFLANWSATYAQVVYVAEPSVNVTFGYLYPLGVCPNGSLHTNESDFYLADQLLGLTSASSRSIEGFFDANNNSIADSNATFKVFGRTVTNVPVAKISATSPFSTGIFWQGRAGSSLCYDGAKDLVFAVSINKTQAGTYAVSDYELMIPQELARYKTSSNRLVSFYGEYRGQSD